MKDDLGERMKGQYEDRTRVFIPRRTWTIVRVDGKAFHTLTRGCDRPYDEDLMNVMRTTAIEMVKEMQGANLAYVQSDEISILLTDFAKETTSAWFDGNIQKISSVSASMATAFFNANAKDLFDDVAFFDGRCFSIPDPIEVENYFIWRQIDATRNSIQMAAQAVFSHKELLNKNNADMQEMLFQKGINWNNYPARCKRGQVIVKVPSVITTPDGLQADGSKWDTPETPVFTQDRDFLRRYISLQTAW
jgi:tRNA(His) guanylyltransferase